MSGPTRRGFFEMLAALPIIVKLMHAEPPVAVAEEVVNMKPSVAMCKFGVPLSQQCCTATSCSEHMYTMYSTSAVVSYIPWLDDQRIRRP